MKSTRRDLLKKAVLSGAVVGGSGLTACAPEDQNLVSSDKNNTDDISRDITLRSIMEAEKVQGIEFTPEERQMMLSGLEQDLESFARLRSIPFSNDAAPAMVFDPRVQGQTYKSQKNIFKPRSRVFPDLPDNDNDIAFADIGSLGHWLRNSSLTSKRLTQIYLSRIEQFAPQLECFILVMGDEAIAAAAKADIELQNGRDRGRLHGIPYALKDLADVKNSITTWGAAPYKDRVSKEDARVVERLKRSGAVLLGKATCGALAYGDIWFDGKTRNPWNKDEGSSGSSAGSASATAAGLCAFSIGTETLGSLVSPSERCGTTTIRPTFGRVSRAGFMALCWSLDKVGPICRNVEDNAVVLAEINGYDRDDPSTVRFGFTYDGGADLSDMTVGYVPAWFENGDQADRDGLEAMKSLGVQLKEFTFPDINFESLVKIVLVEAATAFSDLTLTNRDDELVWQEPEAWPNTWRQARFVSAVDYVQIDRLRRQLMIALNEAFQGFDALIGPHYAGGALLATNCTGHPQLALRSGFMQSPTRTAFGNDAGEAGVTHRVPRGISLWGPLFGEGKMLALGAALEEKLDVYKDRPVGFS